MGKFIDLTGKTFGRLLIKKRVESTCHGKARWLCKCNCGKELFVYTNDLNNGHTKSCGCLRNEQNSCAALVHGMAKTPLYATWCNMKQRCYDKNSTNFEYYGGRGIKVCDCIPDFQTFYNYVSNLEHYGESGYSLDRIDNNGHYCICSNNLRWATRSQQSFNQRLHQSNKSGYKGVYYKTRDKKWIAKITLNKKTKEIGSFNTAYEAHLAREEYIKTFFPDLQGQTN